MFKDFYSQPDCDRCHKPFGPARTESWFTSETICMDCADEEIKIKKALKAKGHDTSEYESIGYVPVIAEL